MLAGRIRETGLPSRLYLIFLSLAVLLIIPCSIAAPLGAGAYYKQEPPKMVCGQIDQNATTTHNWIIEPETSTALFFLNWTDNQSRMKLNLINPGGERIEASSEESRQYQSDTYEYYFLNSPENGTWTIEIKASTLNNNREDYCLTFDSSRPSLSRKKASFNGIFSDRGKDRDRNGLYDLIAVKVGVNVEVPGVYSITGCLYDQNDTEITAINDTYLGIGAKRVYLDFYSPGAAGPRRLRNLTLTDENGNLLDRIEEAYQTRTYKNMQKDFQSAKLSGGYSDYAVDSNDDSIYDILTVEVGIMVQTSGEYTLTGELRDADGEEVVWAIDHAKLLPGYNKMMLDFDGKTIHQNGVNGPYHLSRLLLTGAKWWPCDIAMEPYITSEYNISDFSRSTRR